MVDPAPMQQDMPVGYRFSPTDEELVGHYLRHKLMVDDPSIHDIIPEIEVCNYEPWELPAAVSASSLNKWDDPEWFFFSRRDYKYSNSTRCNRATSCGYWKVSGGDREIMDPVTNNVIGSKKFLVFYQGGIRTDWHIHEYQYCDALFPPNQGTHVLCKLMRKSEKKAKEKTNELIYDTRERNHSIAAAEYENQANGYMNQGIQIPESNDFGGSPHEVGSTSKMLHEGESDEEFDVNSFFRSSPSKDEQE